LNAGFPVSAKGANAKIFYSGEWSLKSFFNALNDQAKAQTPRTAAAINEPSLIDKFQGEAVPRPNSLAVVSCISPVVQVVFVVRTTTLINLYVPQLVAVAVTAVVTLLQTLRFKGVAQYIFYAAF
jgi:hypothetical protein